MRRLGVWSLGFPKQPALNRALASAGWSVRAGWRDHDAIGVWGRDGVARRGHFAARRSGKPVITIEDGFLRSVFPGAGGPILSLIIDDLGIYYDARSPSRLEALIAVGESDESRALRGMEMLRQRRLSKYNHAPEMAEPPKGHVLVIDQTAGDASIKWGMAKAASFARMLEAAKTEYPGAEIVIKTHPETASGVKSGHFSKADAGGNVRLLTDAVNPWGLIENARAVYTVTSQLGFEALSAGRPVRCFGAPFYAGWGATVDELPLERRSETRSASQIFAAAMLDYPTYFDPWRGGVTTFEAAVDALSVLRDHHQTVGNGAVVAGARLWKRRRMAQFLSTRGRRAKFIDDPGQAGVIAARNGRRVVMWGAKATTEAETLAQARGAVVTRIEDGFLRSTGLGAALTPPVSLAEDDLGVYFDASRPSRMERLIANASCETAALDRAKKLREQIVALNVTKYNLKGTGTLITPPRGRRVILVPGQVEDDASILTGAGDVRTNLGLLQAVRQAAPEAWVIYKPHPDVEAGLRVGRVDPADVQRYADDIAIETPADIALQVAGEVWTMTSLFGFEALLRGKLVTTFGSPFYAGWGLTQDRGEPPARRAARPSLDQLVHAVLIDYPRYWDPVSKLPAPPELIVERLAANHPALAGPDGVVGKLLSKVQGSLAGHAWLWR
ncbi:MAG: capsular polysaccharide biosynthesis protein [Pikeienuella sp.]